MNLKSMKKKASGPVIQSELIKDDFLKIFIPYLKQFDFLEIGNNYLVDNLRLKIDGVEVKNIDWYSYMAPENDQLGIKTLIDISHLEKGHYQLTISDRDEYFVSVIPFWKEN